MEDQCYPLTRGFCFQDEGMDELRQTLLYTTLELETTLISAKEEIARREFELIHLKDVLSRTIKERDEAQTRCQKLTLEKLILQQQLEMIQQQKVVQEHHHQEVIALSGISSGSEDESNPVDSNKQISSSDSKKGIIPSPQLKSEAPLLEEALKLAANRPLPEKGKLLQAVKEAGPLLQTLFLAGPLPQWQHPPPQLHSIEIPPVAKAISSPTPPLLIHQDSFNSLNACISKKRGLELCEGSDSSPITKYQKPSFN
ncbi:hypothetical protein SLEP1_g5492 [Rubroshorea leprosula]|uniref:Uncharacterized protein n=1 Tax=Rubroshorea leprosula TaxID=152421 RepID=A0AAV5HXZ3_9ROSI|nr:hypothetical protein SLEP1_g5492 [Rubroshorea leprosula]